MLITFSSAGCRRQVRVTAWRQARLANIAISSCADRLYGLMSPRTVCFALAGKDESAAFRNELRVAREACMRDAEAFDEILFVVERLGSRLVGRIKDLGGYDQCLSKLALAS